LDINKRSPRTHRFALGDIRLSLYTFGYESRFCLVTPGQRSPASSTGSVATLGIYTGPRNPVEITPWRHFTGRAVRYEGRGIFSAASDTRSMPATLRSPHSDG
jgi:hypothetical protein